MTVVAHSAPSTNGSWWRGRGFLLVAGATLFTVIVGLLKPEVLVREPTYPISSIAIAATSMVLAAGIAAGVVRRRRR